MHTKKPKPKLKPKQKAAKRRPTSRIKAPTNTPTRGRDRKAKGEAPSDADEIARLIHAAAEYESRMAGHQGGYPTSAIPGHTRLRVGDVLDCFGGREHVVIKVTDSSASVVPLATYGDIRKGEAIANSIEPCYLKQRLGEAGLKKFQSQRGTVDLGSNKNKSASNERTDRKTMKATTETTTEPKSNRATTAKIGRLTSTKRGTKPATSSKKVDGEKHWSLTATLKFLGKNGVKEPAGAIKVLRKLGNIKKVSDGYVSKILMEGREGKGTGKVAQFEKAEREALLAMAKSKN